MSEAPNTPQPIQRHIDRLFLDPNNYRLIDKKDYTAVPEAEAADPQVQKWVSALLMGRNQEDVRDLITSFRSNGFLPIDQIQVKELSGGDYLVLEGNRRVAALKYLYQEWKQHGRVGKLTEADFKNVPIVLLPQKDIRQHLVGMGLKHISGPRKWNPLNQAQMVADLLDKHGMSEDEVCQELGISKYALNRSRRILALVNQYKQSDFGDQFEQTKFSIFEEIVKSSRMKEWLGWEEIALQSTHRANQERLFSWISRDESIDRDAEEEEVQREPREPIITKSAEIRDLAKYITDDQALERMETARSIAVGLARSDEVAKSRFSDALEVVRKNLSTLGQFADYMKPDDTKEISKLRDTLDRPG